jgi:hypothetical protein
MPLVYISVPPENRTDLIAALRKLELKDGDLIEDSPESGDLAISFKDVDPFVAAEATGRLLIAASEVAGRQLGAIATGEAGWGDPPQKI